MASQTIILRKHWIGLVGIWLAGLSIATVLVVTAIYLRNYNDGFAYILLAGATTSLLASLVQHAVYRMSYFEMDEQGITAENWLNLFTESEATCEWRNVQDVDHKEPGILSQLFGFGTLYVQTAGNERNLILTMVPDVDKWAKYMQDQADAATYPVTESHA